MMKKCNKCGNKKELSEFDIRGGAVDGRRNECKECRSQKEKARYIEQREKIIKIRNLYVQNNKTAISLKKKKTYKDNKEEILKERKLYRNNHKEERYIYNQKNKESISSYNKYYRITNRSKINALRAKRVAQHLNATPPWLSQEQLIEIETFYQMAQDLTNKTNTPHEVDHIIPLQGKSVCGLHVPWNLQILTQSKNRKKGNKCDEEV